MKESLCKPDRLCCNLTKLVSNRGKQFPIGGAPYPPKILLISFTRPLLLSGAILSPPIWGYRLLLAAQSKVDMERASSVSTCQRAWHVIDGTTGLGYWTHNTDGSLPMPSWTPDPMGNSMKANLYTHIHTYVEGNYYIHNFKLIILTLRLFKKTI